MAGEQELARLLEGNKKFVEKADVEKLKELAKGQKPYAVIVACSDSRVVPEKIFNADLGELFVVRVAGNIACESDALGSIEYAVEHLGCQLVVVLGHSCCGAVTAACKRAEGHNDEGSITSILKKINPAVVKAKMKVDRMGGSLVDEAIVENVMNQVENIVDCSQIVRTKVREGVVKVKGAVYDLQTGEVKTV
ncbi:carbonic anhydrase [Candidatus Micrarchaeota archaeon]|nr:carbonic anhydrase [Candidatus Micrarchaeota archaeon]